MTRSSNERSGLRPIDLRCDMRGVAELIENVFSGSLDPVGRHMLRWMQNLGRLGWFGWILSYWLLPPAARPLGFVWEAGGRVVGNASLLSVEGFPGRWVLSNVAVQADFRRRGIARALVQAAIDLARQRRGKVLTLQVDADNHGAVELYASLDFRSTTTRTTWSRTGYHVQPTSANIGYARRRRPDEWQKQWELARRIHPEGLIWPYPMVTSLFRPRGLAGAIGLEAPRHWVWMEGGALLGSLMARRGTERGRWRLILFTEPTAREGIEKGLLTLGLVDLTAPSGFLLDHPAGVAEVALRGLGFQPERMLTWMEVDLMNK